MQPFSRYLFPGLLAVFAIVCLYALRSDVALISLAPLMRAWDLVLLAVLFSLLNYALRIVCWQRYLARLGRPMPLAFVSLTSAVAAIGIYAVAVLVGALSFPPGGLGGTEATMTALLVRSRMIPAVPSWP